MTLRTTLAAIAAVLAFAAPLSHAGAPGAGDAAPDYLGKRLNGDQVLVSQFAGKVMVVSFWATWCGYCLKELPVLENLQKVATRNRVEVIGVNTEDRDTFKRVTRSLKDLNMGMANDANESAAKSYGVNGIPHLVIIGRDGKIVRVFRGYGEETLNEIVSDINVAIGAVPAAGGAAP